MAKTQRIHEGEEIGGKDLKRCFCGEPAHVFWKFVADSKKYWVACTRLGCWEGPKEMKESRAITAWENRSDE